MCTEAASLYRLHRQGPRRQFTGGKAGVVAQHFRNGYVCEGRNEGEKLSVLLAEGNAVNQKIALRLVIESWESSLTPLRKKQIRLEQGYIHFMQFGASGLPVKPGAARNLFVAGTILVAAHVTLLAFDPRASFPSNLFILMYPLLGVTVCLLGAYSESQRPGHCGSCSGAVCCSQRLVSLV